MKRFETFFEWLKWSEVGMAIRIIPLLPSILVDYLTKNGYFSGASSNEYGDYYTNRREGVRQVVLFTTIGIGIGTLIVIIL